MFVRHRKHCIRQPPMEGFIVLDTCYKYDALHRSTSITHPSGSYASVTPDRCFVYDFATVHGVSMSNAKGHLAEAYTVSHGQGCSASKITDEGFGYSSRGEVAGTWEYTSAFGNWYQTTATYWANGTPATLAGPTSVPTFTFGIDGEGRTSRVSPSSGQNPVTATSYNSTRACFINRFGLMPDTYG
jgi:hypothetical protein